MDLLIFGSTCIDSVQVLFSRYIFHRWALAEFSKTAYEGP